MQRQLQKLQQEFAEYKNHRPFGEPPTPQPSPKAQVHSGSSRQGATAGHAKSRGGGRGRVQCSNCDKFGHRDKDCTRPSRYSPPPPKGEESKGDKDAEIKTIRGSDVKGYAQASFRDRYPVQCTFDTSVRRNMIDPALVHRAAIEPIDDDEIMYGKPHPTAMGQSYAVFILKNRIWLRQPSMLCQAQKALC